MSAPVPRARSVQRFSFRFSLENLLLGSIDAKSHMVLHLGKAFRNPAKGSRGAIPKQIEGPELQQPTEN